MGADRQYIDGNWSYGDVGPSPTQQNFVNIDPLLTLATNAGDTTPSIWCPTWNEPIDIFDAAVSERLVPVAFPAAQSFSSSSELSLPETGPSEPVMVASRASITASGPLGHASHAAPPPPKGKKPRRTKQQRRQKAQQQGDGSRRSSQELPQASSAIKREAKEQEGEEKDIKIEEDEETKRSQFLARNRLAASKSRQRKREWEENLEARTLEAEHRYSMLKTERSALIEKIGRLKEHIFSHGLCKDLNIDKWLQSQASNFVADPSEQHDSSPLDDASLGHRP